MKSEELKNQEYKYGFTTDIENIKAPKGLNEETIHFISKFLSKFTNLSGRIHRETSPAVTAYYSRAYAG